MEKRRWGLMPPFGRHEGRIGEDDVGEFVPALLGGQRVVFVDVRIGEAVQVEVHQREAHHVGRDVVALEFLARRPFSSGRECAAGHWHRRWRVRMCL